MFETYKQQAKKALPSADWLANAKETAVSARHTRTSDTPSFPTDEVLKTIENRFTDDDPRIFLFTPIESAPREVEIRRTNRIAKVVTIHIERSELPNVVAEGQDYSLWFGTVLERQWNQVKPQTGEKYILAYHGRYMKGKTAKDTDPHVFNIIAQ